MAMLDILITIAYTVIVAFSLLQLVGSYRWPTVSRFIFFVLFGLAAYLNAQTVLTKPWVYDSYAEYALPLFSQFILGAFTAVTTPFVLSIVVGQAFIAISIFLKGDLFRIGCLFGIIFCLAIAPLGLGAAFPATLLLAIAFYRLFRHESQRSIVDVLEEYSLPFPLD